AELKRSFVGAIDVGHRTAHSFTCMWESARTFVTSRAALVERMLVNEPVSIMNSIGPEPSTSVGISRMWPKRKTLVQRAISGATEASFGRGGFAAKFACFAWLGGVRSSPPFST